jgi:hypothetical protein
MLIRDRPCGDGNCKGTEIDVLYGEAMDCVVMAHKGTETDVLYGMEMAWRADTTAHMLITLVMMMMVMMMIVKRWW